MMRRFGAIVFLLLCLIAITARSNTEGDILNAWKVVLEDPNGVLQSWEPTLVNPCTWFHVTCNLENSVTRVDLGNAGLSGPLIPQLGDLANLQYLEVFSNNISGAIPVELGKLNKLVSLDLYSNKLTGAIPPTLANLKSLRFLRLNSNTLTGRIPIQVLGLISWGNLEIMNVSDNHLAGSVHHKNKSGIAVTTIIQDAKVY